MSNDDQIFRKKCTSIIYRQNKFCSLVAIQSFVYHQSKAFGSLDAKTLIIHIKNSQNVLLIMFDNLFKLSAACGSTYPQTI